MDKQMYTNKHYTISPSVFVQSIDDETLLMNSETELFYELNAIGSILWEIIQEKDNLDAVVDEMLERYDAEKEQIEKDLESFIQVPIEQKMILVNS